MRLTKDEIRILAAAFNESMYQLNDSLYHNTKEESNKTIKAFDNFYKIINEYSKDNRRTGRTSHDSFKDLAKRIVKKYQ